MDIVILTICLFASLLVVFALGLPPAFGLGGVAMVYALVLWGSESLMVATSAAMGTMMNFVLLAVPLFVFMGSIFSNSGIADRLYATMYLWMGPLRGGLAMATVAVGTIMAAMVGLVSPGIITLGLIALPAMRKRGYQRELACGSIMAAGGLGTLIPPSVSMMLYAMVTRQSLGRLFMGGIIPGFVLSALYMTYIGIKSYFQPEIAPALPPEERATWIQRFVALKGALLPMMIIVAVMGSIFFGIATPTEAGAVGVLATLLTTAIYRRLNWPIMKDALYRTMSLTGMAIWITIGASLFNRIFITLGGAELITGGVLAADISPWLILIGMQISLILMGMITDDFAIVLIAAPIYSPIITALGFDPLWFAILFMINMQIAVLSPPFGFALFYMKGTVPPDITIVTLYRAVVPFILLQILGLALVMIFPALALTLPRLMYQ
ncbi:TRAP transporter large permease subunit [Chloroflexota bacterium]